MLVEKNKNKIIKPKKPDKYRKQPKIVKINKTAEKKNILFLFKSKCI